MHNGKMSKTAINNAGRYNGRNLFYNVTLRSPLDINAIGFRGTPTATKKHNTFSHSFATYLLPTASASSDTTPAV
jgi:hypothetical protein